MSDHGAGDDNCRGELSEPCRGGLSEPCRGGLSEPCRGGLSEPCRGGLSERSERNPPSPAADNSALVAALKTRDDAAFEHLVRTHAAALLRVTRRFLRNEDDARDAVQDAFLSVLRSIDSFEGGSRLSTWLHRIAINAALQKLRTRRRRPETPIEKYLPEFEQDGHHARVVSPWPPADELLLREETRDHVRRAIEQVPESYRVVLLLRDIEGLDTEETARLLGLTQNAVKIRLHRARQALRGLLDPHLRKRG